MTVCAKWVNLNRQTAITFRAIFQMQRQVLIINTGGTIGMRNSAAGYQVDHGFLARQLAEMPEMKHAEMPGFEVDEFDPVIDSAYMTPVHWALIAEKIHSAYEDFDAFLVLHGTDTMAYTASSLAFMLGGLSKTVIITGSQIPLCETRNDARDNLVTTLMIAGNYVIPEVCIYFGNKLLRGCRTTKVSVDVFDAFDSPNYLPLGEAGTSIQIFRDRIRQQTGEPFGVHYFNEVRLGTFRLFPGMSAEVLENLLAHPLQGLILETYGVGTGPSHDQAFLDVITQATDRGVIIVSCSQCDHGKVSQRDYAAGTAMADAGVVSGSDMTVEAALAKLHFLLSQKLTLDERRDKITTDLVGELSRPHITINPWNPKS
jgi:L-asparaginase